MHLVLQYLKYKNDSLATPWIIAKCKNQGDAMKIIRVNQAMSSELEHEYDTILIPDNIKETTPFDAAFNACCIELEILARTSKDRQAEVMNQVAQQMKDIVKVGHSSTGKFFDEDGNGYIEKYGEFTDEEYETIYRFATTLLDPPVRTSPTFEPGTTFHGKFVNDDGTPADLFVTISDSKGCTGNGHRFKTDGLVEYSIEQYDYPTRSHQDLGFALTIRANPPFQIPLNHEGKPIRHWSLA